MTKTVASTATTPKMTYVSALAAAVACDALPTEVREKLEALRVQQEKRNSAEKKPTKVQQANAELREVVLEALATAGKPVTVSELMAACPEVGALSNQKVAALVRQLVDEGRVARTEEKRKAYFSVVGQ